MASLQQSQPPAVKLILTNLINDLVGFNKSFALVLDDYQVIASAEVHEILHFLLDHLPAQMHIVIITRADPPLPLSRLRARGQMTEIRGADLRFTTTEAAGFLNDVMRLGLSKTDIEALESRTEGWIAGLQMAALSLSQQSDKTAFVTAFSGDDRHVMDYLLEEVLQVQPTEIQTFLQKTSILDRLCSSLCDAVTGETNSQANLNYLEQSNLFVIPLDSRRIWYRYHPLFADLLRHSLRQKLNRSQEAELVREACAWYEQEGLFVEAISQAFAGPDLDFAAILLERNVLAIFFRGHTMMVHRWLKLLPEDVLHKHPLLCAVFANTLAHTSYFQPNIFPHTEYWLQAAIKGLNSVHQVPGMAKEEGLSFSNLTRSFIALSRAYLALWKKEPFPTVVTLARQALSGLPPAEDPAVDSNYLRFHSGLNFNLGLSLFRMGDEQAAVGAFSKAYKIGLLCGDFLNAFWAVFMLCRIDREHGRLTEALKLCHESLKLLEEAGYSTESASPSVGMVFIALGQILLEWNKLDEAESWIKKGEALSRFIPGTDIHLQASLTLASLQWARGDIQEAFRTLDQFASSESGVNPILVNYRVRFLLQEGDLIQAGQWARTRQLSEPVSELELFESLTLVRVLIAQYRSASQGISEGFSDLSSVIQFLNLQSQSAGNKGKKERLIEFYILLALAYQAQKDLREAENALRYALELAEPGGYVRLFVNEGLPMHNILSGLWDSQPQLRNYIDKLLSAWVESKLQSPLSTGVNSLVEALTKRELEVLHHLAAGSSNAEICKDLYISLNTTKKHIAHIFEKLAVNNRKEAVARARQLGVLPKSNP